MSFQDNNAEISPELCKLSQQVSFAKICLSLGTTISNGATKYMYKNFSPDFIALHETDRKCVEF
jgi:hypothetical protein